MDVQTEGISAEELQLAARNHGMPLEALRLDLSPPGLHYVLVHYDVPFLDAADAPAVGARAGAPAARACPSTSCGSARRWT